jgi:hypothetical protein
MEIKPIFVHINKEKTMENIKISKNEIFKSEVRQIENELDWAVKNNNYERAQELLFELIKVRKNIK